MNILSNEESETIQTYNYMQKLQLKNDIEKNLEQKELIEILKILVDNNIKLSQNYTGVLFDLKYVPNTILEKIEKYINFCSENRKNQLENDSLKSEYKKQLKPDTYKYETSIEDKTMPLTNLYQKYKNVNDCDSVEIPTYNVQDNSSMYKVNVSIGNKKTKNKNKNKYKTNLMKFKETNNTKDPINIDIDIDNLDDGTGNCDIGNSNDCEGEFEETDDEDEDNENDEDNEDEDNEDDEDDQDNEDNEDDEDDEDDQV